MSALLRRASILAPLAAALLAAPARAQIVVHPNGVNVASQGATTVYLTYGGLADYVPVEAFWCGELIPAAPDVGQKCDPATLFGQLPIRYDQSALSGGVFTDIMSVPTSVARRAYQAAAEGRTSSFFYVRRFVSPSGGPDQYVAVTCRMAGGGARVPLALVDVDLRLRREQAVAYLQPGEAFPAFEARIRYNGTGRLVGRWEVVLPGEEPPGERDLLTEATLPPEERGTQRRYTVVERFNVLLGPDGTHTLPGPRPSRMPTAVDGTYLVLLRIEASDDKEGDSNRAAAGAGAGLIHSGGVAGFPMPTLRFLVGSGGGELSRPRFEGRPVLVRPLPDAALAPDEPLEFTWVEASGASFYRVELRSAAEAPLASAIVATGGGRWHAPPWLREQAGSEPFRWRVVALSRFGDVLARTPWRRLRLEQAAGG